MLNAGSLPVHLFHWRQPEGQFSACRFTPLRCPAGCSLIDALAHAWLPLFYCFSDAFRPLADEAQPRYYPLSRHCFPRHAVTPLSTMPPVAFALLSPSPRLTLIATIIFTAISFSSFRYYARQRFSRRRLCRHGELFRAIVCWTFVYQLAAFFVAIH